MLGFWNFGIRIPSELYCQNIWTMYNLNSRHQVIWLLNGCYLNVRYSDSCSLWKRLMMLSALTYNSHLNTGLVWYANCRFVSGCQKVRYCNGGLKNGLKKACLWSKMSGIQMVHQVTWLSHLNTRHPYGPVFRWLLYYEVRQMGIKERRRDHIQAWLTI